MVLNIAGWLTNNKFCFVKLQTLWASESGCIVEVTVVWVGWVFISLWLVLFLPFGWGLDALEWIHSKGERLCVLQFFSLQISVGVLYESRIDSSTTFDILASSNPVIQLIHVRVYFETCLHRLVVGERLTRLCVNRARSFEIPVYESIKLVNSSGCKSLKMAYPWLV